MTIEIPEPGTPVRIRSLPGCPQEGGLHGIYPYIRGARGIVAGIETNRGDHCIRVDMLDIPGHPFIHEWFTREELDIT